MYRQTLKQVATCTLCISASRFVRVLLLAIALIPSAAYGQDSVASTLTPEDVISLTSLWKQLRDIDNRPWDSFKQSAVRELSQHISTYISNDSGKLASAIESLRENGFEVCLRSRYNDHVAILKKDIETLARDAIDWSGAADDVRARKVTRYELVIANDLDKFPTSGQCLACVCISTNGLHIRVFDRNGKMVVDLDEKQPKSPAQNLEKLKQSVSTLLPPHVIASEEKVSLLVAVTTVTGQPTVNIPIPESLAELRWLLGPIEPWLRESAKNWATELSAVEPDQRAKVIELRMNESIHDYAYALRRVAKLQLVVDSSLSDRARKVLALVPNGALDPKAVRDVLRRFDSLLNLDDFAKAITTDLSQAEIAKFQTQLRDARRRALDERIKVASELQALSINVTTFFDKNAKELTKLEEYFRRLYDVKHVDLPLNRQPNDPAPFLRMHVTAPENERCVGVRTAVDVRISICRWIGDTVSVTGNGPSNGSVQIDQTVTDETGRNLSSQQHKLDPIEDIPLGIRIAQVHFTKTGSLRYPTGVTPKVSIDPKELSAAMRRLGLPEQFSIDGLGVEVQVKNEQAPTLLIRGRITPPSFVALFGSGVADIAPIDFSQDPIEIDVESLKQGVLQEFLGLRVDSLQEQAENLVRQQLKKQGDLNLRVSEVESLGKWRNGVLAYRVGLQLGRIGKWKVPAENGRWTVRASCQKVNGKWQLKLASSGVPNELLSFLHSKVTEEIGGTALDEGEFGKSVRELERYIRIDGAAYDPNTHVIKGILVFAGDLIPADSTLRIADAPFSLNLGSGDFNLSVFSNFKAQLESATRLMLAELNRRVHGELTEQAAKFLKEKELKFFGAELKVVGMPQVDKGRIRFDVKGKCLGKEIEATRVLITGGEITAERVNGLKFDFRETILVTEPAKLIAETFELDQSLIRIGPVTKLPEAISFPVSVHIEPLGGDVLLGVVSLGSQGVNADTHPLGVIKSNISKLIETFVKEKLANQLVVEELGPIHVLHLDNMRTTIGNPLEIWVTGKAEIPGLEDCFLPFSARVFPGPPKIEVTGGAAAEAAAKSCLSKILPENFLAGSPVKNAQPLVPKPYGFSFDLELKACVFTVEAKGIRVTTKGIELPASISVQPPGMIPVPNAFAIVDPGVVVPLNRDGEIGIVGDVTLASKGIDKIVKFHSVLSTSTRNPGKFKLDGMLILVDMLPLLKVDGVANFKSGTLDLNARTVGVVDKIIQVRDRTHVEAAKGLFEQNGSMGVLGIRLSETNIGIEVFGDGCPRISASARVSLPIATAQVGIKASPRLDDIAAHSEFDVSLGKFSLTSGKLDVDFSKVDFRFHVVIFDVRVIAPSVTTLTPGRVLESILNLFDFDVSAFLNAIVNRNVTISFFDDSGTATKGSIGTGDPPPPDGRPGPKDAIPPGSNPGTSPESNPGTSQSQLTGGGLPPSDPGSRPNQSRPTQPRSPDSTTSRHEPIEHLVRTQQKGDATYQIIPDPDGSGLFIEKFKWRDQEFFGWMLMSKACRDHILGERSDDGGKPMVLTWLWRSASDAEQYTYYRDPHKNRAFWVSAYLTINPKGQYHICGRFPDGKVEPVEIPVHEIGPDPKDGKPRKDRTPQEIWELFSNYDADDANAKFTHGDIAVISQFANARFLPNHGPAVFHGRLGRKDSDATFGKTKLVRPEGYLYSVTDVRGNKTLAFQPREGWPLILDAAEPIYAHLNLSKDIKSIDGSQRSASAIALLSHASSEGVAIGYISGDVSGPMTFVVGPLQEIPRQIWRISESGNFSQPLTLLGDGLNHMDRSRAYFGDSDGTVAFAKAFGDEVASGLWNEVTARDYDIGTDRGRFLAVVNGRNLTTVASQLDGQLKELEEAKKSGNSAKSTELTLSTDKLRRELLEVESNRSIRTVFAKGTADASHAAWSFVVLYRDPRGKVMRFPSSPGVFNGEIVNAEFQKWVASGKVTNPPFSTLDSQEARRWYLNELLEPERKWVGRWKADPVTLLRNLKTP